jgi:C-terminal processing protease CtpA/Prc
MSPYLRACSTERAYRREACSQLLSGERDSTIVVKLALPDRRTETLTLKRNSVQSGRRPAYRHLGFNLTRQKFVHFGHHPSGLGYIWIESFSGHEEIADEFDTALQTLRDTPGLIIDVRDNPGGFGQPRIVGRFITTRTLVAVTYKKNGPGHADLAGVKSYLEPGGNWQYKRPVALLVNDVTGSAADLFACYMRSAKRVTIIGSTTHGNLSGIAAFAVLPCGLVVRISNGYVCDATGRPIEGKGTEPDIAVSPGITDFLANRDPALDRAVAFLSGKKNPGTSSSVTSFLTGPPLLQIR